jgi:glycosyltransferase involved in cell wall biosynthesis
VAYAGRFAPEKGVEVLVEACRHAGLPMRFAGDAPAHPAVRKDDDAAFVMTRSPEELAQFYRGARVVVMPSIWAETFGVVAAEAMSHGVPVVVSRIGALTETVVEGVTGLYANPGDARDLARQLRRVWDDAALARELGRNGRIRVEETFSERMHFERLARVYDEVCGASAPVRR